MAWKAVPAKPEDEAAKASGGITGLLVPTYAFWLVCLTVFVDALGGAIAVPVLPFYAEAFDVNTAKVGLVFSAFNLSQVLCLPLLGRISDIVGRRGVLYVTLFGGALGAAGQGLAPTFWVLVASRAVSGACAAVTGTANTYVSDITTDEARGRYLSLLLNCNGLALAVGPGLGGLVGSLGLNVPAEINGGLCFAAGVLAMLFLPESPVFERRGAQPALKVEPQRSGLRSIPLAAWGVCLVELMRALSFTSLFAFFGVFEDAVWGLSPVSIGLGICGGACTIIATNLWISSQLGTALGEINASILGTVLMGLGQLTLAYGPALWLSLLGTCVVYMGQAVEETNAVTIMSKLATDANRGEIMAIQQTGISMGRVIGPLIWGPLFDVNCRYPFAGAAFCMSLTTVVLVGLRTIVARHIEDKQLIPMGEVDDASQCI
eukprot:CAMPEP_0176155032 /NCGR_PEP_ID=MMETSP0120_2-20121206/79209_1 /TAXON_ID=160619 /ORGANISM="Kryptoperidinium foliaceum, Strain CCMP 1326" /LENGTH=432 /DNA_ID=CAMNT_0017492151 /DNA_START=6 /DNA_END=1304 /DNA_ORIENTATION=-